MNITLNQLLKGKGTSIKNRDYFPTAAYVEPFIERVSKLTNDIRIQAVLPDQITYTKDDEINLEDLTFNRVWIQAVLPDEYPIPSHNNVIGMVYGLDVRRPVFKVYRGALNAACTNLCVFNPEELACQEIEPETSIDFRSVDRMINMVESTSQIIKNLMNTKFNVDYRNANEQLGKWIRNCIDCSYNVGFGKVKIACSSPIDAFKLLFYKEDSDYFVKGKECSMYQVYGALTQTITDSLKKDIMNQAEKTLLIKDILGL